MRPPSILALAATAGLALFASTANATVTFGAGYSGTPLEVNSNSELAYASDVSNSDLIEGMMVPDGVWNVGNNAHPNELTDGIHGATFNGVPGDKVQGAWTTVGANAVYDLGAGTSGLGYDLSSINSIAAWSGGGLGQQAWTIEVRPLGGSFETLATVDYQPFSDGNTATSADRVGGATKVTMTNLNVTGIDAIRITPNEVDSNNNFVWRELDVVGAETTGSAPPAVATLTPPDDSYDAAEAGNLEMTFNMDVQLLAGGTITIRDLDDGTGASDASITIPDPQVSSSGAVLTIDPSADLGFNRNYAIRIDSATVANLSGDPFAGFGDDTSWNFSTGAAPLRIMPIGDSITVGYTNADWSGGAFEFGYRSGLYTRLTNAGYNFTLVGSSTEPWSFRDPATTDPAYPPTLDLPGLGQDGHNGYAGKAASFLNSNILTLLANDDPDVILLMIGTNAQDLTGLTTLVNTITTTKPNLKLIIAEIMPKWNYEQGIVNYNTGVRALAGRNVTVVDQYAPFLTNLADLTSIDRSLISNGINHPDSGGYDKMAQVWFDGIQSLGFGSNNFSEWIGGFDGVGGQTGLIGDPDGDGIPNGVENFFGTAPDEFSPGLAAGTVDSVLGTFMLTHPQGLLADDLAAAYQWSKDLQSFHGNLASDTGGTTVGFTIQADTPEPGTTTVTATVTGTACDRLFLRVAVTQN